MQRGPDVVALVLSFVGGAACAPLAAASGRSPVALASSSVGAAPASSPTVAGALTLCPLTSMDSTCPLPAGGYANARHDGFDLTLIEAGWQEVRALEPTVVPSRIEAPDRLLVIDTGQTGGFLSDASLLTLLADTSDLQVSPPAATLIGGAPGFQVDLGPTAAQVIAVPGAGH